MPIIEIQHVFFKYSEGTPFEQLALKDISLTIHKGEFIGIIGHTGSGKSTLVQLFNGLKRPHAGKVLFNGEDIWKDPSNIQAIRFKVGLVFQNPEYQLFAETVYQDIAYGPQNMHLNDEDIDKRIKESLGFVGLTEHYLKRSPFKLSGGEMRCIAIAGIMAMNPEVLILDEPTAGLDPYARDMMLQQIEAYRQKSGNTIIIISHSMEDIAEVATRIIVMDKGAISMSGLPDEIFSRASELENIGLSIPQVTKVFMQLKELGLPINSHVFTLEQAEQEILGLLKRGKGK